MFCIQINLSLAVLVITYRIQKIPSLIRTVSISIKIINHINLGEESKLNKHILSVEYKITWNSYNESATFRSALNIG